MAFRSDGLNNPLSPNSGFGLDRRTLESVCEKSPIVEFYEWDGDTLVIDWTFGETDRFDDLQQALIAIQDNDVK